MRRNFTVFMILVALGAILPSACVETGSDAKSSTGNQIASTGQAKVTFIELGSVKCIPCKAMQPIMREIESEYGDQVKVVFHDVWTDEGGPFAQTFGIRVIPTQVFLDASGKEYFRHEGFFPKDELIKVLKQKGVN
jgi:thioredoxin 1